MQTTYQYCSACCQPAAAVHAQHCCHVFAMLLAFGAVALPMSLPCYPVILSVAISCWIFWPSRFIKLPRGQSLKWFATNVLAMLPEETSLALAMCLHACLCIVQNGGPMASFGVFFEPCHTGDVPSTSATQPSRNRRCGSAKSPGATHRRTITDPRSQREHELAQRGRQKDLPCPCGCRPYPRLRPCDGAKVWDTRSPRHAREAANGKTQALRTLGTRNAVRGGVCIV